MLIIGHRGAKGEIRANTVSSVRKAIEAGVDMVEFDVMTTKDSIPVLYHGFRLSSWGRRQLPEKLTFKQLLAVRPHINTLAEVLDECKNIMVNIDIKSYNVKPILDLVESKIGVEETIDKVIISSHLIKVLRRVRNLNPAIKLAYYTTFNPFFWIFYHLQVKLFAIGMHKRIRILIQPLAHAMHFKTYIFSVNNKKLLKKYEKLGTWGIITDRPSKLGIQIVKD